MKNRSSVKSQGREEEDKMLQTGRRKLMGKELKGQSAHSARFLHIMPKIL